MRRGLPSDRWVGREYSIQLPRLRSADGISDVFGRPGGSLHRLRRKIVGTKQPDPCGENQRVVLTKLTISAAGLIVFLASSKLAVLCQRPLSQRPMGSRSLPAAAITLRELASV